MPAEARRRAKIQFGNREIKQGSPKLPIFWPSHRTKNRYNALKEKLLQVFEESEARKLYKLIGEMELGDQGPSQLLTKMTDLVQGKVNEDTLSLLWKIHLPMWVRAVLTVSETNDLALLTKLADQVLEYTSHTTSQDICRADHNIPVSPGDLEKTAIITPFGLYNCAFSMNFRE